MAIKKAVAYSRVDDSWEAGKSAIAEVIKKLGAQPDFLFLFATVGHDMSKIFQGIESIASNIPLCGCSGLGSITNLGCDEATHSLTMMGLLGENVCFHPFIVPGLSADCEKVGREIGNKIKLLGLSPADKQLLFLFPDGLTINSDGLFKGIESMVGYHIDFVGGSAGNDYHFSQTYQFCDREVLSDAVAGVLITGDFNYSIGVSHGSKPLGNLRTVTKAQDNIIYEIDNEPALELLTSLVGEERLSDFGQALNLLGLGQSFEEKGYDEDMINRAIIGIDKEQESIKLGVPMPVGSIFRMTRRNEAKVKQGTQSMAHKVMANMQYPQEATYFYFNCAGRGSYLFGEPEPDVNNLVEVLGNDKDMIGFFTFGEIAPVMGENYFHNFTGIFVGIE
ncbi:MAG TPA: FIST N-terminal domain-containing protein [Kamptonema sp.]|nr:FIST N-terminal domain-containing protein [Kamptonema sp.]